MHCIQDLFKNVDGGTAVEYALIITLVAIGCAACFALLGGNVTELLTGVQEAATSSIDGSLKETTHTP